MEQLNILASVTQQPFPKLDSSNTLRTQELESHLSRLFTKLDEICDGHAMGGVNFPSLI